MLICQQFVIVFHNIFASRCFMMQFKKPIWHEPLENSAYMMWRSLESIPFPCSQPTNRKYIEYHDNKVPWLCWAPFGYTFHQIVPMVGTRHKGWHEQYQWTGRTDLYLQMNQLSLKNYRFKVSRRQENYQLL